MTVGSLFTGIGGLDLALEHFGHRVIWQAESDGYARAVLAKHWPAVKCFEDVREIDATSPPPDIICGGFPCQDISNAGKRVGIDGERSGLWSEFARIIRELRPRLVFVENVAALTVRGLDRVLGDLAALGFDAEWDVLRAADVGAPHLRARIFILAFTNRARLCDAEDAGADSGDEGTCEAAKGRRSTGRAEPERSGSLPHAQRDAVRVESGRLGGTRGAGTPVSGPDGVYGNVAHADEHGLSIERSSQRERSEAGFEDAPRNVADGCCSSGTLADAHSPRRGSETGIAIARERAAETGQGEAEHRGRARSLGGHWAVEPPVGRVAHGVPRRVDRLRCLGNAVVWQQAAFAFETLTARAGIAAHARRAA